MPKKQNRYDADRRGYGERIMTEAQLKRKVVLYIRENYPNVWVYCPADFIASGIPDILICLQGRFIAIELKIKGKNTGSKFTLQNFILSLITKAGGIASVCYSLDEVKNLLDKMGSL